ncbi:MAG: pantetheine-phosphate adenylyltransferase [candidate division WOR-3 bacterium]
MRIALYPGTFDPITNGHIDIVKRALKIFDHLILLVSDHYGKRTLFSLEERKNLCEIALREIKNVEVQIWKGLLVEYLKTRKIDAIIRGIRAISDFEYEFQMGMMNRRFFKDVEILYFFPGENYIFLSSSILKEIALFNGDISDFVPREIERKLKERLRERKEK